MARPADVHETVSRELSLAIEAVVDNYEAQGHGPPTLASVREAMAGGLLERLMAGGRLPREAGNDLFLEVGTLIERYGDDAIAVGFARPRASEILSTVIQAAMDRGDPGRPPTLSAVREAMRHGLLADLVGHGHVDSDDEQTLFEEIDALIGRHGEGALAEELMRYY